MVSCPFNVTQVFTTQLTLLNPVKKFSKAKHIYTFPELTTAGDISNKLPYDATTLTEYLPTTSKDLTKRFSGSFAHDNESITSPFLKKLNVLTTKIKSVFTSTQIKMITESSITSIPPTESHEYGNVTTAEKHTESSVVNVKHWSTISTPNSTPYKDQYNKSFIKSTDSSITSSSHGKVKTTTIPLKATTKSGFNALETNTFPVLKSKSSVTTISQSSLDFEKTIKSEYKTTVKSVPTIQKTTDQNSTNYENISKTSPLSLHLNSLFQIFSNNGMAKQNTGTSVSSVLTNIETSSTIIPRSSLKKTFSRYSPTNMDRTITVNRTDTPLKTVSKRIVPKTKKVFSSKPNIVKKLTSGIIQKTSKTTVNEQKTSINHVEDVSHLSSFHRSLHSTTKPSLKQNVVNAISTAQEQISIEHNKITGKKTKKLQTTYPEATEINGYQKNTSERHSISTQTISSNTAPATLTDTKILNQRTVSLRRQTITEMFEKHPVTSSPRIISPNKSTEIAIKSLTSKGISEPTKPSNINAKRSTEAKINLNEHSTDMEISNQFSNSVKNQMDIFTSRATTDTVKPSFSNITKKQPSAKLEKHPESSAKPVFQLDGQFTSQETPNSTEASLETEGRTVKVDRTAATQQKNLKPSPIIGFLFQKQSNFPTTSTSISPDTSIETNSSLYPDVSTKVLVLSNNQSLEEIMASHNLNPQDPQFDAVLLEILEKTVPIQPNKITRKGNVTIL